MIKINKSGGADKGSYSSDLVASYSIGLAISEEFEGNEREVILKAIDDITGAFDGIISRVNAKVAKVSKK